MEIVKVDETSKSLGLFGINGMTSTIGSVLTLILYINYGFRITFLIALIVYFLALFIIKKLE